MKEKYIPADAEVITFVTDDVITVSNGSDETEIIIPQ